MLEIILWILGIAAVVSITGGLLGGGLKFFLGTWIAVIAVTAIIGFVWCETTFVKWLINISLVPWLGLKPIGFWTTFVIILIANFLFGGKVASNR